MLTLQSLPSNAYPREPILAPVTRVPLCFWMLLFWTLLFWLLSLLGLLTLGFAEGPDIRAETDVVLDNPCSRMTWISANPSMFSSSLRCVLANIFHIRLSSSLAPSLGQ